MKVLEVNTKKVRRGDLVTVRVCTGENATIGEIVKSIHTGRVTDVYYSERGALRFEVEGLSKVANRSYAWTDQLIMVEKPQGYQFVYSPDYLALSNSNVEGSVAA